MSQVMKLKDHLLKFVRPVNDALELIDNLVLAEQKLVETKEAQEKEVKLLNALKDTLEKDKLAHKQEVERMKTERAELKNHVDAEKVKLNFDLQAAQESFRQRMGQMEKKEEQLAKQISVHEARIAELMARADEEEKRFQKVHDKLKALKETL